MVMVHPGPSLFAAKTEPPMALTNFFTKAKPIPVPPPADAMAYQGKLYRNESVPAFMSSERVYEDYARLGQKLYELAAEGIEEAVYGIPETLESLAEFEELDRFSMKD